jgi:hypothetical protein
MPPSELFFVGTVHNDLKGPLRLLHILDHLNPDVVSIESTESARTPSRRKDDVVRVDELRLADELAECMYADRMSYCIQDILNFAFERECAYSWAVLNNKRYVAVEEEHSPELKKELSAGYQRIAENHRKEYAGVVRPAPAFQSSVDMLYSLANMRGLPVTARDRAVLADRDEVMARRLHGLDGKVVHISGVMHICGHYLNLAERCNVLEPTLMTLYDAEIMLDHEGRRKCEQWGLPAERLSAYAPSR